jgi:hypothetical protein
MDPEFRAAVDKDHDPATKEDQTRGQSALMKNCGGAKPSAASNTGSHRSMHRDTRIRQTGSQQVVTQQAAVNLLGGETCAATSGTNATVLRAERPFLYNAHTTPKVRAGNEQLLQTAEE